MFSSLIQKFRKILRDENGPTAVEYAVMLALIIVVCIFSIRLIGSNASNTFRTTGKALELKQDGNQDGNGQW